MRHFKSIKVLCICVKLFNQKQMAECTFKKSSLTDLLKVLGIFLLNKPKKRNKKQTKVVTST